MLKSTSGLLTLTCHRSVFYHLDYLSDQPTAESSALFRHRMVSDQRRKSGIKLDLSAIEDPLITQAGAHARRPDSPMEATGTQPGLLKKTRSPERSSTPPSEIDVDEVTSDDESNEQDTLSPPTESHLLLHTRVYALAEKYDIPSLKLVAQQKFEAAMACYYDAPEFAEAVEEVYCSTIDSDRGLRDVCLQAFATHPQLVTTQDVYAVIENTP